MKTFASSRAMAARAGAVIPGGVNSLNRRLGWPLVVVSASGASFTDADGTEYLDYHAAYGPVVLGHAHPPVNEAVVRAVGKTSLIGAGVTDLEIELAETVSRLVPSAESVLLTNSGSEATYAALRLARAATGRELLIKFQGAYHGWHDAVLLNVISTPERIHERDILSEGMHAEVVEKTLVLPFNDVEAVRSTFEALGDQIAAVIVEVIQHNIGCVLPSQTFLSTLRDMTTQYESVLIFDEVITGFRHGVGGYQALSGVTPDLTTLGKAMANGYPISALVGRSGLMSMFESGQVVFAGTFNGNPVGVAAASATIAELEDGTVLSYTTHLAEQLAGGLRQIALDLGIAMTVAQFGSVLTPYFFDGPVSTYSDLLANRTELDVWFRAQMCASGIFMIPIALKRNHVSASHSQEDIDRTLETAEAVLRRVPPRLSKETAVYPMVNWTNSPVQTGSHT